MIFIQQCISVGGIMQTIIIIFKCISIIFFNTILSLYELKQHHFAYLQQTLTK